jgi:hypothetical protein
MTFPLKPRHGGFLRPFGCGWFIREYLLGKSPFDSQTINPKVGAPQSDIFQQYKMAIIKATALDRATRAEEKKAKKERRSIDPDNIEQLAEIYETRLPYKANTCRYHSFVIYFSNLQRLGWVEFTGREEPSEFQAHYAKGQPKRYFRLTAVGEKASDTGWANPLGALYEKKS